MKFSENWLLKDCLDLKLSNAELCKQLTMSGCEVEDVSPVARCFKNVVVGQIINIKSHPTAEHLVVCDVNVGAKKNITIVSNLVGLQAQQKLAVALIGAEIEQNKTVKAIDLHGITSDGLFCSAFDLSLGDATTTPLVVPSDAPIGKDLREYLQLDDLSIEVGITPNRGDCLSLLGIAREVAVLNHGSLANFNFKTVKEKTAEQFPVNILDGEACPHYVGRVIRHINAKAETPIWLQERLRRSGIRSISAVVDVTNYVMLELGQPMHAFDLTTLSKEINVRKAKQGEKIQLLDERMVELLPTTLVIADQSGPIAMAGIMGGLKTSVTSLTQDIFLESAFFAPKAMAGQARRYGMKTDSSFRFERGVDPNLQIKAIERATQLLIEIAGGDPGPVTSYCSDKSIFQAKKVSLRFLRVAKLLGFEIPESQVEKILTSLGFEIAKNKNTWQVSVPTYRFDIQHEEDLIEEIMRIYGYEQLPMLKPSMTLSIPKVDSGHRIIQKLKQILITRGYSEVITYSFVEPRLQAEITPQEQSLALVNPISSELSVMRTSLWTGLITTYLYNQSRQQSRIRIFETGLSFVQRQTLQQEAMFAGLISGPLLEEQWGIAKNSPHVDFFDIKNDVEALFATIAEKDILRFEVAEHPALHPGQSACILLNGERVGWIGKLHPKIQKQFDIEQDIFLFELKLAVLLQQPIPKFKDISKFPSIRRDISFLIEQSVSVQQVIDAIKTESNDWLMDVTLFDVYQGKNLPEQKKSFALSFLLQHPSRTLQDAEITSWVNDMVTLLQKKFAITLRD